jgi:hypothetical protein
VHHAVAVEPMVAAERLEVRVGPDAVEGAVEIARQLAFDFEIERVALFAPGRVVAAQIWLSASYIWGPPRPLEVWSIPIL